ncbi:UvrD-helicase domain-containing protein [Pelomonas sp. APW6]|uniref:DNA 3'-5' helicase n=1 Tax=Roseateles subflavus TaxID=3053353 RepID=A0ABT7LM08_9BURK|nr:UvrD-helicase domain-containing protein [Pelomonas sp. APW6]MDL5033907.1 UvrD-helicase domain-containing protein [Pelomonas sp. APW6]
MNQHAAAAAQAAYTVDGRIVPREQFYTVACDPRRSVVVEACAGAGKTWMLVSRILRALLEGVQPQQIVAITFTRKAAGEMRQRLSEWLAEFARTTHEGRCLALRQRGMSEADAERAAPLLQDLQQQLLQGGRPVEIRTFHAWFSQLLRAAPMALLQDLGIAPELQLLEDESELMPDVWRSFHARVLADAALLSDYQGLVDVCGRSKVLRWLEAGFAKRVELRLADAEGVLMSSVEGPASVSARFAEATPLALVDAMRSQWQDLALELGQGRNETMRKAAVAIEQALTAQASGAALFEVLRSKLLTKAGTPVKALSSCALALTLAEEVVLIQRGLDQLAAQTLHQQLSRLSLVLIDSFDQLKQTRGLVDMNDLERGALAVLGDAALAGWVQERLDAQLRHLLIDEFQDTSPLQWQALYAWLSSYTGAGGGGSGQRPLSVFIVGDPKQSIYRFRRAEPRVFAAARDFLQRGLDAAVLACDHTRRNAPEVLEAVNAALSQAQALGEYQGFRPHTTESSEPDALAGVWCLDAPAAVDDDADVDDAAPELDLAAEAGELAWRPSLAQARHEPELQRRAAEAERVARALAELLAQGGLQPGDVFVLARRREALRVLAEALKARGIAHVAPEEMTLLDAPDVRDLLALLDALASPAHDLSLAHALRSPLFDVSEAGLLQLSVAAGTVRRLQAGVEAAEPDDDHPPRQKTSFWQALMQADDASLEPALQRARLLLGAWSARLQHSTPHELLDRVLSEGDLLARVAARVPPSERRSRLHALQSLLGLALDLDGGRYATVYGFVRALRQRALSLPAHAEADAVQLLTVHGAKGLEARVVVMMDCDAAPARADHATLLVDWPVDLPAPRRVAFIASESTPPPALEPLMRFEQGERQREELNALYVAMTRAKSRLVLSRSVSARAGSASSWWQRLRDAARDWQPAEVPLPAGGAETPTLLELPVLPPQETPSAAPAGGRHEPAELVVRTAELDEMAALGEAMHRVLEWVSGPQGQGASLELLVGAAAQMYGLDARRSERLDRAVRAILASPECSPFFDTSALLWAGNEVPVSHEGQDLRLDRLVLRAAEPGGVPQWWVLDYKLHEAPQRQDDYVQQLQQYRAAVQALQPGEPVRTAFITGQGRLVEVVG